MKHCPECNVEYRDTAIRCSDCDVELAIGPPTEDRRPDLKLESVYATSNPAIVALVKSLLDDAGIEYLAKGDAIQDLVGWGRFLGFNNPVAPFEFLVASEDAPAARDILARLEDPVPEDFEDESER